MLFWMALKALAVWVGILVLAVLNGAMREAVLIPKLGTPPPHFYRKQLKKAIKIRHAFISSDSEKSL